MHTGYGEIVKVGDWVVWAPRRGSLNYGKVVEVGEHTLKVKEWSIHSNCFYEAIGAYSLRIVKTKAVLRAIPMSFLENESKTP